MPVRLARLTIKTRAQLIHIFSSTTRLALYEKLVLGLAGRLLGRQTVFNLRSDLRPLYSGASKLERTLIRHLMGANSVILCQFNALAQYLSEAGFACHGASIEIIPNGIEVRNTPRPPHLARRAAASPTNTVRYIYLGQLTHLKGLDILLQAISLIQRRLEVGSTTLTSMPKVVVDMFGNPSQDGSHFRALAAQLGITSLARFHHPLSPTLVQHELSRSDALVLPSRREGFPNVILEAMISALPVIATSVGAIPEVVSDGQTGILVPPADVEALANAMMTLASNPTLRQKLGAEGTQRAAKLFSLESSMTLHRHLYGRILSGTSLQSPPAEGQQ